MTKIQKILSESKKIVIKIGSNVLSTEEGRVNTDRVANIVTQMQTLIDDGKQVMLVSSGAGIFGVGAINKWSRRKDINYMQALCAIGQVELMQAYKDFFASSDTLVAQILVTGDDFSNSDRTLHIRNTMFTLIDEGVVPIINENDTVSVEEIRIGDNDNLSAFAANLWDADVLVILSDTDGVFDKDPKRHKEADLIEEIDDIEGLLSGIETGGLSSFGTGGIETKIEAASRVAEYGIPTVMLNGKKDNIIPLAKEGKEKGTAFVSKI